MVASVDEGKLVMAEAREAGGGMPLPSKISWMAAWVDSLLGSGVASVIQFSEFHLRYHSASR